MSGAQSQPVPRVARAAGWALGLYWAVHALVMGGATLISYEDCGPDSPPECGMWDGAVALAGGCMAFLALIGLLLARRVRRGSGHDLAHAGALLLQGATLAFSAYWLVRYIPQGWLSGQWIAYLLHVPAAPVLLAAGVAADIAIVALLVASARAPAPANMKREEQPL